MSAKKAAKKSAKKAAKKGLGHHGPHHHEGKELRKAYEHLGRLSVLEPGLPALVVEQLKRLTTLAQTALTAGELKSSADLLRAGEHLAFGTLAATASVANLGDALEAAINAEYEHLTDKSNDHWDRHEDERPAEIEDLYASMTRAAEAAFNKGAYRRALEFARGAEALAHVRIGQPSLEDGGKKKKLKA